MHAPQRIRGRALSTTRPINAHLLFSSATSSMANFFLSLCLLALFLNGSTAQFGPGSSPWQSSRQGAQRQCRLERLSALEPRRRVESEGGVTEYFDDNDGSLNCAGVSAIRETIQPQGLSLPTYFNAHHLIYVVKGRGIAGGVLPGCPETFQSISGQQQQQQGREQQQEEQGQQQGREQQQHEEHGQQQRREQQQEEKGQQQGREQQQKEQGQGQGRQEQQQREEQGKGGREQQQREEQGQRRHKQQQQPEEQQQQRQRASGDQHQRIIRFSQGDILVVPAGMAHWCYNDGDSPVVVVKVLDTSNSANQLDNNPRKFSLAGQTSEQDERSAKNIFRGFNLQFLADALGVSRELTKKLQQGQNGEIIRVKRGLRKVVMPPRSDREEQKGRQSEGRQENGLELALCTLKLRENIDKPSRADVYNPQAGRLSYLNGQKLPILNLIQMSATRGVLYRGATLTPHWNINAHTALYVTGGRGRIQIVGDKGQSVFDQELREGQMVVIPQHFAVVMQAREQQFEWVSFKTHGNAIANQIVGPGSFFRGLPEDVIAQSYRGMTQGEARNLKNQESLLLPGFQQEQGGRAEA